MPNNQKKGARMGGHGPMNPAEKAKDFKGTLKKIIKYLKTYKLSIFFVIIFAIASTVFSIYGPKILGKATTEIFNGIISKITGTGSIDFSKIGGILAFLLCLYILSAMLSFIQGFIMNGVANKVSYRLRKEISIKINKLPMKFFDKKTHGEILSCVTNDVDTLSQNLSQSLSQIVTSVITLIGILIMMLSINVTMTIAALLIIPLSLGIIGFIVKKSQKHFVKQQEYLGTLNGTVEEVYSGHDVVKVFNGEEKAIKEFNECNEKLYETGWKSQFLSGIMHPIMNFVGNLGYVVVSILGGYLTIKNKIEVGDILSFTQYVRNFNQPIAQMAQIMNMLQGAVAAERVFEFLEEKEEEPDTNNAVSIKDIEGNVEFKNVSFGYDESKTIINNFNAKVKKGQKIAIVGPTGAGKTTMVKLLMRFYDVSSGEILIDGINIKDFKRSDLRSLFGMVLQDTWLFSGTIADNIKYGKLDASIEDVKDACRAASVHHFIKTLPDGYDMILNEESDNISQGQKQLLTIARVILANPKILILDEATSSVDTRTEVLIQDAMDKLMEGRTSFVIAHRLSTIKNADMILTGNHEELLKKNGFYATLYNSQFEDIEN